MQTPTVIFTPPLKRFSIPTYCDSIILSHIHFVPIYMYRRFWNPPESLQSEPASCCTLSVNLPSSHAHRHSSYLSNTFEYFPNSLYMYMSSLVEIGCASNAQITPFQLDYFIPTRKILEKHVLNANFRPCTLLHHFQ